MKDFSKAQMHLKMAEEIRPLSYQIQHALARNYLKHAICENRREEAEHLFELGANQMISLIESKEKYKEKARDFSIHCYVTEWLNYLERFYNDESLNKKDVNKMYKYIEMMKHKDNKYYRDIVRKFVLFLKKHNKTSLIWFTPDSLYIRYMNNEEVFKRIIEYDV